MNWRALDLFRSSHSLPPAMGLVTDNLDNPDFTSRTTWNIVLSCIVTVLACSWAAIQPNISYPANRLPQGSKRWGRHLCTLNGFIRDQMFPIVVFIISPEFILAWAMRQRRQAKHMIAGTGLTRKHGLFAIMGGYYFYDDLNEPSFPVYPPTVFRMARNGQIELPSIEEINDNNKGNGLLQALVLLQACWFITQCSARAAYSINISKMELLSLGYVSMALCTYIVFWDKPRNVGRPIRIPHSLDTERSRTNSNLKKSLSESLSDALLGFDGQDLYFSEARSMPPFWAGADGDDAIGAFFLALLVGGAFTGMCCIAWSYETSSLTELVLWRLSSLAGLGYLILVLTVFAFFLTLDELDHFASCNPVTELPMNYVLILSALLYAILRVVSIVLAVRELSVTYEGMYRVVQWTDFIPHL